MINVRLELAQGETLACPEPGRGSFGESLLNGGIHGKFQEFENLAGIIFLKKNIIQSKAFFYFLLLRPNCRINPTNLKVSLIYPLK
jgi:hypothetical protein